MYVPNSQFMVHRCGPGGSMRACHAAGPGSIPGRDMFPGWGFSGVFPHLYDKCREALGPQGPRISFGHHDHQSPFITDANDLRCWRALKPQIYIHNSCSKWCPCAIWQAAHLVKTCPTTRRNSISEIFSNFVPGILFELLKWMRVIRVNFNFSMSSINKNYRNLNLAIELAIIHENQEIKYLVTSHWKYCQPKHND